MWRATLILIFITFSSITPSQEKLSASKESDALKVLNRKSLGENETLGVLYDATTDRFLGQSIFTVADAIPPAAVKQLQTKTSELLFTHGDSYAMKMETMGISLPLAVSMISGMFDLYGSSSFLNNFRESNLATHKTNLVFNVLKEDLSLNLYHEELFQSGTDINLFNVNLIAKTNATHVVTGISYGASLIISCEYKAENNFEELEVEEYLKQELSNLYPKKIKVVEENETSTAETTGTSVPTTESSDGTTAAPPKKKKRKKPVAKKFPSHMSHSSFINLRLHHDFKLSDSPQPKRSLNDTLKLIVDMPDMINNMTVNGQGLPIQYRLVPIPVLRTYLNLAHKRNELLNTLKVTTLTQILRLFDKLVEVRQELQDFHGMIHKYRVFVNKQDAWKVYHFVKEQQDKEAEFKARMYKAIADLRAGPVLNDDIAVENLLKAFHKSGATVEKVKQQLADWEHFHKQVRFGEEMTNLQAFLVKVDNQAEFEGLLGSAAVSYMLLFKGHESVELPRNRKDWGRNKQLFVGKLRAKTGEDPKKEGYFVVDCQMAEWEGCQGLNSTKASVVRIYHEGKIENEDLLDERKGSEDPCGKVLAHSDQWDETIKQMQKVLGSYGNHPNWVEDTEEYQNEL